MRKINFLAALLIGLPLLAACSPPAAAPTQQPVEDVAQSVFGPDTFTLSLPAGWDVFGPETILADPDRPYDLYLLGIDPTSSSGPGTSRVIIAAAQDWSPETFALAQCSTCPAPEFEAVNVGGQPGQRAQIGGGDVPILMTWYFVEHNGKLFAIAIHDPATLEPLIDVIESIRFE